MSKAEWTGKYLCGWRHEEIQVMWKRYGTDPDWVHDVQYIEQKRFDSCEECHKYADKNIRSEVIKRKYKNTCIKELKREDTIWQKILQIIAVIFGSLAILAAIIALFYVIVAAVTVTVPFLVGVVKGLATFVYGVVKGFISVFKPIIQGLKNLYDNWIEPTLTWVQNKVTQLTDAIYKVYDLTVGGIVDTYNSLFGWVGGVQARLNDLFDKTASIVAIFNKDLADKIKKVQDDMNDFVYKYTAEWYDKILTKIAEYTGPILKQVGEIQSFFTLGVDKTKALFERTVGLADNFLSRTYEEEDDAELEVYDATERVGEEVPEEAARIEERPPEVKETEWDRVMMPFVSRIATPERTADIMSMAYDTIEATVKDVAEEAMFLYAVIDKDVEELKELDVDPDVIAWSMGEITFGTLLKRHWAEILFDVQVPRSREAAIEQMEESTQIMRESGIREKKIERFRERQMKRINKKFPVSERGF